MSAATKRALAVSLMKSRAGKNSYTNGAKRTKFFGDPEGAAGFSDCSSAVRACIQRAAGIDIGRNTDKQLQGYRNGVVVDCTKGAYPDESKLLPGDCLYFKGNTSHFKAVGHVEMYTGANECWGHGSGMGPTKKDLEKYCTNRAAPDKRYFVAIRWILDDAEPDAKRVMVTARGKHRIHEKPSALSKSLGVALQGRILDYVSHEKNDSGKWIHVSNGTKTGWISEKYIKKVVC